MLRRASLAVSVLCILAAAPARAGVELPGALRQSAPDLRLVGSGKMTWFGLHIKFGLRLGEVVLSFRRRGDA